MNQMQLQPITPNELSRFEHLLQGATSAFSFGSSFEMGTVLPGRVHAWQVVRDGEPVAVVVIGEDGMGVGHVNLAVFPDARRQGVGTWALRSVVTDSSLRQLRFLHATIAHDNMGAQKLLEKSGFSRTGHSGEGYLQFERRVTQ